MDYFSACDTCDLNRAGAMAAPVCYPCRENDSRRRFCIAFAEGSELRLFLAADDEESVNNCVRKLAAQGQPAVTLIWSQEQRCYLSC